MGAGEAIGAVGGLAGGADCMAMGCGGGEPIAGEDADSPPSAGGSGGSGEAPKASADAAPHEAGSGSGDAAAASGAGEESSTDSVGSNAATPKKADAQQKAAASSKSAAAPDEPSAGNSGTTGRSSGGERSRCSFSPSTPVLMAGGKTKAIGKIKTGDKVESADPETGKHKGARTVQHIWINHDKDLLDVTVRDKNGHKATLHTTANHPFWNDTSHSWKPAGELRRGNALNTADDGHAYVVRTRVTPGTADRWNLTVQQLHTYYVVAGGTPILVHNTDVPESCPVTYSKLPKDAGHRLDYELRDKDGNLKVAGGLWSGNATIAEKALGGWNRWAATNTENRLMRMFGIVGKVDIPGDEYFGVLMHIPLEQGDVLTLRGLQGSCGRCQGMMNEFMDETDVEVRYTWRSSGTWP
ncbi:hypothetical protein FRZ03_09925 [Streptomyces misionensis]|uniref:Hint domain-containing protein n=1 Tax=Streptomyces misionensis TaxID=67331 RepID=A0A5C6JW39_9ACTN|nr:polymorphic toxin-type HINT domain-containing protein [Streptomyces misionensis]TWV53460.1 hypothetical protein FRZ03_09925 [Streptomyces misionensis]